MIDSIVELIGKAAVYEQLAEEAAELAQAALKCARILRGENPTPITWSDAYENLVEERMDVLACLDELDVSVDFAIYTKKMERWKNRIQAVNQTSMDISDGEMTPEEKVGQWCSFIDGTGSGGCTEDGCDLTELLNQQAEQERNERRESMEELFNRNQEG